MQQQIPTGSEKGGKTTRRAQFLAAIDRVVPCTELCAVTEPFYLKASKTVCRFHHLLELHELGRKLLATVNEHLERNGIKIGNGTIVDTTITSAPSSSKNCDGERDLEMLHELAARPQPLAVAPGDDRHGS